MGSLGAPEILLVLVIVLIFFGVGKLPQVGTALGQGIREFRKAAEGTDSGSEAPKVDTEAKSANGA